MKRKMLLENFTNLLSIVYLLQQQLITFSNTGLQINAIGSQLRNDILTPSLKILIT